MQQKNRKLVGLLAAVLCTVCVLTQPLLGVFANVTQPEYLGTAVNGWVATCRRAGGHANEMNQVKLEKVDENTTRIVPYDVDDGYAVAGRFDESGNLVESTLKPSADGRYAFTVQVNSAGLDADEVYVPFGSELNGHWHRNCEITKDGLRIRLVRSGSGMKLYVDRPVVEQDGQMLAGVRYDTLKAEGIDFSLDTAHRFVIATKDAVTSVYVDDVLFGSVETTESYLTAKKGENTAATLGENLGAMLAVGSKDTDGSGSAACTVEVRVNVADRGEELTALIAECEALQNDKASDAQRSIFAVAITRAKNARTGGEETLVTALRELKNEKAAFVCADAGANGWAAAKSPTAGGDLTGQVLLYDHGEEITEIHAPNFARGAAVKNHGLFPIRTGKFAIDFTLKSEALSGNGHSIWIPILWECYGDANNPQVAQTNNGIAFVFTKVDGEYRLSLQNRETGTEFHTTWQSIDLSRTVHLVVETVGGATKVYVNHTLYGQTHLTDSSNYLWSDSVQPTIALGGGASWDDRDGGGIVAVMDTHAQDSTERLQALIVECEKAVASSGEKAALTIAIGKAKADMAGEEAVVLQAIHELEAAKTMQDDSAVTVNVVDYEGSDDDADMLNRAIGAVVATANADPDRKYVLNLEKKTYRLDSTLWIYGANNLTIEGNGASLVWTELIRALILRDCTGVTLQNFSMNYDPLPFTQGVVTAVQGTQVTVAIDQGYRTDITNILPQGNGLMTVHDRATGAPVAGAANYYYPKNARHTDGQNVTFTLDWQDENAKKIAQGDVVCLFERGEMTLEMSNCSKTTYYSVNMYSSPGFLFNEGYSEGGTVLKNCQIVPGAKPTGAAQARLRSSNGDAAHFGNVKNGPTFDSCRITHSGDDGLNVQGFFHHVIKVSGETIWVTPKWDTGVTVGDTIEAYEKASYATFGTAKITGFERLYDSSLKETIKNAYTGVAGGYQSEDLVYKITLDKTLDFKVGDHITSLDRIGSGTTVKNCTFGYNTARGIVVKGRNITIENNTIAYTSDPAIFALADLNWCESGFPQNVTICGNRIEHCNSAGSSSVDYGAIFVGIVPASNMNGFLNNYNNTDIRIENNGVTDTQAYGIFATNCDGITVTGNTIERPFVNGIGQTGAGYGLTPNSGLFVGMSKNVTVTGNTVVGGGMVSQAAEIHSNCSGTIQNSSNTFR